MKTWKRFFLVLMSTGSFLMGCASPAYYTNLNGLVPFEYFETIQKNDERLIIVTPALKEEFEYSLLYIISNYEDMQRAQNKLSNLSDLSLNKIDNLLKEFSPVRIPATHNRREGIGIFSLPPTIDKLFFVYFFEYKKNSQNSPNKKTMFYSEIMPLPPGKETADIYFNEKDGALRILAMIDPKIIRSTFENSIERFTPYGGLYGAYYNQKPKSQVGYIPLTYQTTRDYMSLLSPPTLSPSKILSVFDKKLTSSDIGISDHKSILTERDIPNSDDVYADQYYRERLAAVDIISSYYTIQQETRSYSNLTSWNLDVNAMCWVYHGGTNNNEYKGNNNETKIYTIDVPTRQEIPFTLYQGNNRVYSGTTPVRLIHLHPETEYTVRWVSKNSNFERKFTVGYNSLGPSIPGLYQGTAMHHIIFLD